MKGKNPLHAPAQPRPRSADRLTLVIDGLRSDPGSLVANVAELLLSRSLKVAAVVVLVSPES
jgi:hypothetical protein